MTKAEIQRKIKNLENRQKALFKEQVKTKKLEDKIQYEISCNLTKIVELNHKLRSL